MFFRLRTWIRRQWLGRRPVPSLGLPFELDEFARLLSSCDPAAFRKLADGLASPAVLSTRPDRLKA
jgi:hypothetical protein